MSLNVLSWRTLSTRVVLLTLALFLTGIWSLALYTSHLLRLDMTRLMGEQQFSATASLAAQLNEDLDLRLQALQAVASELSPALGQSTSDLQSRLERHSTLGALFNGGAFVTALDGTATASVPMAAGRVGLNFMEQSHVAMALHEGKSSVGNPRIGKALKTPVFGMAAPVRDRHGKVIGALIGVTTLGKPNFLDKITALGYGQTGGYLICSPKLRLVITATDKRRILEPLPPEGILPALDRFTQGYEGTAVFVDHTGVEHMGSSKRIDLAGWDLATILPTTEAFAPIHAMQQRMLLSTVLFSLLAGALAWWATSRLLKRQLAPMIEATQWLHDASVDSPLPAALVVTRQDEIGELMAGFNRMLLALSQQKAALKQNAQDLAITLNSIGDAVIATDAQGLITRMNPAAERMTGWTLMDAIGKPLPEVFHIVNALTRKSQANPVQLVMARGEVVGLANHTTLLARDGAQYQIADSAAPIRDADGQMLGVVLVFSDVSEKYRVQEALSQSESRFRAFFEQAAVGVAQIDTATGSFVRINRRYCDIVGYSESEMTRLNFLAITHPDDLEPDLDNMRRLVAGEWREFSMEKRYFRKDGSVVWVLLTVSPMWAPGAKPDFHIAVVQDISERKQAQGALQASLKEKIALLNEVHHRVKNNLQVITSLLRLEGRRSTHQDTKVVLVEMQGRIRSMALLHESLYRSGTFASADLGAYVRRLAQQAFRAQAQAGEQVQLQLELATVHVSMDQATPCGLLVNELISNCFKHAFPDGRSGVVRIALKVLPHSDGGGESGADCSAQEVCLSVSDTGVGLPAGFDIRENGSLGLQLVGDLARQLGGRLEIGVGPGTCFALRFSVNAAKMEAGEA